MELFVFVLVSFWCVFGIAVFQRIIEKSTKLKIWQIAILTILVGPLVWIFMTIFFVVVGPLSLIDKYLLNSED